MMLGSIIPQGKLENEKKEVNNQKPHNIWYYCPDSLKQRDKYLVGD